MQIAIIGAGMAGLACGERLAAQGHKVSLFDKGRGPGGRMATRRVSVGERSFQFDHGAQYFHARDPRLVARVAQWEAMGVVARWPAAGEGAWVGVPGMNAPVRAMAAALPVRFGARVERLKRDGAGWRLEGEGLAPARFDAVVVAVPAEQAASLLAPHAPAMGKAALAVQSTPCWTLMAAFAAPITTLSDVLREADAIGWAARNSAKPGRGAGECWVVQATPEWSIAHLEHEPGAIAERLLQELAALAGPLPVVLHAAAHRWRYALPASASTLCLWDEAERIGACGDWLAAPRVEGAFLSGLALAERIGAI